MKKIFVASLALLSVSMSFAQVGAFRQGTSSVVEGYSLPRTVVEVALTQEREVVIRGPYSKYASKFLGITGAAQSDKEIYKLIDATLQYKLEPDPQNTFVFDPRTEAPLRMFTWLSNTNSTPGLALQAADQDYAGARLGMQTPFKDMGVSSTYGKTNLASASGDGEALRTDGVEKSVEQMASDAASAIFKLRKRRFELITGEQGENVFGTGLQAALGEIDRLEAEYLSLFIGKRFVQRTSRIFASIPMDAARGRQTVCRFSETGGLTSDTDVSGRPINIEYTPEKGGTVNMAQGVRKGSSTRTVNYRIPRIDVVRLMDGTQMMTQERVPFYQFGSIIEVPIL